MNTVRDKCWIWGQNVGSHHGKFNPHKLPGKNHMDAAEGCRFFGIPNCCRVAMPSGPEPPFDLETAKLKDCAQVVWSAVGSMGVKRHGQNVSDIDEVIRQASLAHNVTGAILDDFFALPEDFHAGKAMARHTVDSIAGMRDTLHHFPGRKLDLWLVWYTMQLDYPVQPYLDLCDVVTLWTWDGSDLFALNENIQKFVDFTPNKRRLAGCYLWNYGENCPLTPEQMQYQLECYERGIERGVLEGIVVCSNCTADLGLDTVEPMQAWIERVGNKPL